jgi:hypothetical protein
MRPIAACALVTNKLTRVNQVTPESPGIPHAMVYGLLRALPGAPGFLATVACATSRRLDTSVGVSGPHAFAVRFRAVRHRHYQRPPHPDPRFVTLRNAPLWDGTAGNIVVIWVFRKTEYFCKRGLTAGLENGPSGKSDSSGDTLPSVARPSCPILNLGMPFSAKCSVRTNPPCNGPVHLSMIRLRV